MKKSKKKKQLSKSNSELPLIKIGSVDDHILKATVSVKGKSVYINIDGFLNELDAMMWARMQTELWLQSGQQEHKDNITTKTLH